MHKDAYGGMKIAYPEEDIYVGNVPAPVQPSLIQSDINYYSKEIALTVATAPLGGIVFRLAGKGLKALKALRAARAAKIATVIQSKTPKSKARTVFRGERSSRHPEKVFAEGIEAKGNNLDLLRHVSANQIDTGYIPTSVLPRIAKGYAGKNGYLYVIRTKKGVDVRVVLKGKNPFPEQYEIAIPGKITKAEVMGAFKMNNGKIEGKFIKNPSFETQ